MKIKPKQHEPWEDKIEIHPWKKFHSKKNTCAKLIVGSFPPNRFTTHCERKTNCDMDFFYGSKDNGFWELFCETFGLNYAIPDDLELIKQWLIFNKWGLTDIVSSCKRKLDTAYDTDLISIEWNKNGVSEILDKNEINTIYFTSVWVRDKFEKHINSSKNIKSYVLPSPSRNGLRSIKRATYLDLKFKENESSTDFRKRCYIDILRG